MRSTRRPMRALAVLLSLALGVGALAEAVQAGGTGRGGIKFGGKIGGGGAHSQSADEPAAVDPWAAWSVPTYENLVESEEARGLYAEAFGAPPAFVSGWSALRDALPSNPVVAGEQVAFATEGVTGLLRSDAAGSAMRSAQLRTLSATWLQDAAARGGPFASLLASGEIAGVEFEWLHHGAGAAMEHEVGPVVVAMLTDACWPRALLGYMYVYDAAQLAARQGRLMMEIGLADQSILVFNEPVITTIDTHQDLVFAGSTQDIRGDLQVRDDVVFAGQAVFIEGDVTYGDEMVVQQMPHVEGVVSQGALGLVPQLTHDVYTLRAMAQASGTYFPSAGMVVEAPPAGSVIFAEGDLHLDGTFQAEATFVSAAGNIVLQGYGVELNGAIDHTALVAFQGDVLVSAMESSVMGRIFCPNGVLQAGGEWLRLHGTVVARSAELTGWQLYVTDGRDRDARALPVDAARGSAPSPDDQAEVPAVEEPAAVAPEPTVEDKLSGKKRRRRSRR